MSIRTSARDAAKNTLDLSVEENAIISSIVKNGKDTLIDVIDIISESSFFDIKNQIIFESAKKLLDKNIEITKPNILIESRNGWNADQEIFSHLESSINLDSGSLRSMAKTLKNKEVLIESVNVHRKAIDNLHQLSANDSIEKIFSVSENTLFGLVTKFSSSQDEIVAVQDIVNDLVDYWASNPTQYVGLPTPWPKFNESIGGGMRTGVTLIGSRAGVGKTSIAINVANFLSEQGIPTLILDTEMEIKDVLPRMIANLSDVPIRRIETGDFNLVDFEKNAVKAAAKKIAEEYKLFHVSVAGKSFDEILSIIRRWVYTQVGISKNGKANQCLVIYDYFKIMDSSDISDMHEHQAMGFQVSKLTDFCKIYDIPCLSFVQLNRDGIAKESSDVIAQSDRLLWLVNSFSIFKIKTLDEIKSDRAENGNRKVITLKSRYGGEHQYGEYISMSWKGATCTLQEVSSVK